MSGRETRSLWFSPIQNDPWDGREPPNKGMKLTGAAARSRAMARTAPAAYPRCSTGVSREPSEGRGKRNGDGRRSSTFHGHRLE